MDMEAIRALARELLEEERSTYTREKGEKYYHGQRVGRLAVKLRERIAPDDTSHDDILRAAAMLHDIRHGAPDHCALGAETARCHLAPHCSEEELDEICGIIAVHDTRNIGGEDSLWLKLHQDADHIDHFGAFDIWRTFAYSLSHDQTIMDALAWMTRERPLQTARHRDLLHFDISRSIYDEKAAYVDAFTERFRVECEGGIWGEEKLFR